MKKIGLQLWLFRYQIVISFCTLLSIRAIYLEFFLHEGNINNFLIYKQVFFHTLHQQKLFIPYPELYQDNNHYGPIFSLIILPFALLPTTFGGILWCLFVMVFLFFAIDQLPIGRSAKMVILLISCVELQTAIHETQFNPLCAALIILSYTCIKKGYLFWSTLLIAVGFLVKLYGIVGICFIVFTDDKIKFIKYFLICLIILLVLPMVISSPSFIIQSYFDWGNILLVKNAKNIDLLDQDFWQDISVMGFVRRIFHLPGFSNWFLLVPAGLLNLLVLFRYRQFRFLDFQLSFLAILLLDVVIFSTSSEAATYIIASVGLGIYVILQKNKTVLVIFLASLSYLVSNFAAYHMLPDRWVDNFYYRYSLKVIPYFLVWILMMFDALSKDFENM